ncbi:hypothetical protein NLJ89_g11013 [Agrocybe chaxingu]|uniref:Uncharacterized protein n=1 Tax=Agrocybe chaxingu TaxID=84603 RepID=A0A9W8JPK8_9AGAR|nr:hypothetical protein NLJ89_g11013 [Agrocybe chaxingu]
MVQLEPDHVDEQQSNLPAATGANVNWHTYTGSAPITGGGASRGRGIVFRGRRSNAYQLQYGAGRGRGAPSPGSTRNNPLFIMSSPGLTPESPFVVSPSASPQQPVVLQPQPVQLPVPVQVPLPVQQPQAPNPAHTSVGIQTMPAPQRTHASVGTQTRTVFLLSALSSPATTTAPAIVISDSDSSPTPPPHQLRLSDLDSSSPPPQMHDLEEGSDDDMPASIPLLQLPGLHDPRPEDPPRRIPINPRVRAHPTSPTTTSRKHRSDVDDTKADDVGSSAKRQCSVTVLDSSDEAYSTFPSYPTHTPAFRPMDFMQVSPNLFPTPGLAHSPNLEQAASAYDDGADRPTPPCLSSPFISTRSRKTPARKNVHRGARSAKGKAKAVVEPMNTDDMFAENLDPTNIKPSTGLNEEELFERLFQVKPVTSTPRNQSNTSRSRKMSKVPSTPFPSSGAPKTLARNDLYSKASDFVPISSTPLLSLSFEEPASINDFDVMLTDIPESAVPSAPAADDNFDDMYATDPEPVASSEPPTLSSLAAADDEVDDYFANDDDFEDPTFVAALGTVMDELAGSASQPASQESSAA